MSGVAKRLLREAMAMKKAKVKPGKYMLASPVHAVPCLKTVWDESVDPPEPQFLNAGVDVVMHDGSIVNMSEDAFMATFVETE